MKIWYEILKNDQIFLSENEWTTNEIKLFVWLQNCFEPETRACLKERYRRLILDEHTSHWTSDAIRFVEKNKIILLCLFSHFIDLLWSGRNKFDSWQKAGFTYEASVRWMIESLECSIDTLERELQLGGRFEEFTSIKRGRTEEVCGSYVALDDMGKRGLTRKWSNIQLKRCSHSILTCSTNCVVRHISSKFFSSTQRVLRHFQGLTAAFPQVFKVSVGTSPLFPSILIAWHREAFPPSQSKRQYQGSYHIIQRNELYPFTVCHISFVCACCCGIWSEV